MKIWRLTPRKLPVLSGFEAKRIVESWPDITSVDVSLGKFGIAPAKAKNGSLTFKWDGEDYEVLLEELKEVSSEPEDRIYLVTEDGLMRVHRFSDGKYYQLVAVAPKEAPTLEINGIHMHRVSRITPFKDARMKVQTLSVRRGDRVLDICTGLGYTAIWEKRFGGEVISIEIDENVLEIAEMNPWSWELEKVEIINEDAFKVVKEFEDNSFDKILADPPRFSLAPELYSGEFFEELYRILRPGGRLFLYTGRPGEKSGKRFVKGVLERLRRAGFFSPRYINRVQGILATKLRAPTGYSSSLVR